MQPKLPGRVARRDQHSPTSGFQLVVEMEQGGFPLTMAGGLIEIVDTHQVELPPASKYLRRYRLLLAYFPLDRV